MSYVRPKKSLGQHFLKDQNIAQKIVDSIDGLNQKTGYLPQYIVGQSNAVR